MTDDEEAIMKLAELVEKLSRFIAPVYVSHEINQDAKKLIIQLNLRQQMNAMTDE